MRQTKSWYVLQQTDSWGRTGFTKTTEQRLLQSSAHACIWILLIRPIHLFAYWEYIIDCRYIYIYIYIYAGVDQEYPFLRWGGTEFRVSAHLKLSKSCYRTHSNGGIGGWAPHHNISYASKNNCFRRLRPEGGHPNAHKKGTLGSLLCELGLKRDALFVQHIKSASHAGANHHREAQKWHPMGS